MEEDILLDEANSILEGEVIEDENIAENVEEDSSIDSESNQSDIVDSPIVLTQELVDKFQEFLQSEQDLEFDSEGSETLGVSDSEEPVQDYTDILEDIYSKNVDSHMVLMSLEEDINSDMTKPFEAYTLTEIYLFFVTCLVMLITVFKIVR